MLNLVVTEALQSLGASALGDDPKVRLDGSHGRPVERFRALRRWLTFASR
jgi:hypothetical protein